MESPANTIASALDGSGSRDENSEGLKEVEYILKENNGKCCYRWGP
jgi:hypothetical protein